MLDVRMPLLGFDEAQYLSANPDVRAAVEKRNGDFTGWRHFVYHGVRENRRGVPVEVYKAVQEKQGYDYRAVLPPPHLRKRVHGADDALSFESIGRTLSRNVFDEISRVQNLRSGGRILDFGCGCGRLIKPLHALCAGTNDAKFDWFGSDIDEETITWCQRYLHPIGTFVTNAFDPPLPFPDEFFDFVYSISIFTHLPEDMQFAWLDELRRVTRSGGFLVLSTHGEGLLVNEERKKLKDDGFYYRVGRGTQGLPKFYQTSFHTHDYIRSQWRSYFSIVKFVERGIANRQDLVLCERRK